MTEGKLDRIRNLICCCCGAGLKGRQWHDRDTGYGLCDGCIDFCEARGNNPTYGIEGVHYGIKFNRDPEIDAHGNVLKEKE